MPGREGGKSTATTAKKPKAKGKSMDEVSSHPRLFARTALGALAESWATSGNARGIGFQR